MTTSSTFDPVMEYPTPSCHPHMLSHASSSSSLASLASSHHDLNPQGLLVQAFPSDQHVDIPHSRHSSYSSIMQFDDKPFQQAPMQMNMMDINMYPLPALQEHQQVVHAVPTGEVFMSINANNGRQQLPRLAVQTQGLGKVTRERSASRSTPYNRYRSESISAKSEEGEDIAALLSSSTTYNSAAPWSTTSAHPLNGGFSKMNLHNRTPNVPSSQPYASPISRPMLSRARRSSSFILTKQHSSVDLKASNPGTEIRLSGSAAERQETVRQDLTQKADEIKRLTSTSQQDKSRAIWVRRWLVLSYTHAPGSTVPRQGLYHSYTVSCEEYGLKPINSASFGKAVRSAYPGIKTRRLGVRGNSKYHYVSIRPAIQIEAERLNQFGDSSGAWHVAPEDGSMDFRSTEQDVDEEMDGEDVDESEEEEEPYSTGTLKKSPSAFDFRAPLQSRSRATSINDSFPTRPRFARRHTTAALSGTFNLPPAVEAHVPVFNQPAFPTLANLGHSANDLPTDELNSFWNAFCHHQETLSGCIKGLHFDRYEMNCRAFWSSLSPSIGQICLHPAISTLISDAMAVSYDHMMGVLLDKLNSPFPIPAQSSLRALAGNLETIMEGCFASFPREFGEAKIELAVRAAHLFTRFLDLHQLTIALAPILANPGHIRDMLIAWDTLDIRSVSDQCALSCSCQQDILEQVLADFGAWLAQMESGQTRGVSGAERLSKWVERVITDVKGNVPGVTVRAIACRVGFITSQVMRDFTLKSDKSFGLYQLIKTWIDDYVSIYALRQTALSTSSVEAAGSRTFANGYRDSSGSSSGSSLGSDSMSVYIPYANDMNASSQDLSTAIPFAPGSSGSLQPNLDSGGSYDESGAQYLPMPAFEGGNVITPRAFN
ncbi:hypothetical protein I316_03231 [Kwoniella heveanensis BCC8398]|uniref:RFX-type winged-helix domain-containing protein n=1 Tax=Kwoniella heveanensis BCC8398 TaxID=1296120 RepID=A0A1B9GVZ9_9TREE|nr:hypothetical protein I316_03231 [Kwoniella heveanensis BCC8398]